MNWRKATWENPETWPTGLFLAAVPMRGGDWQYFVLTIDERGNLDHNGDAFSDFDVDSIEWVADITQPEGE